MEDRRPPDRAAREVKSTLNNWRMMLVLSLTLGLAPFFPEPHLFGKIRWLMGGAEGMTLMDWLDLLMHGTPWVLFFRAAGLAIRNKLKADTAV